MELLKGEKVNQRLLKFAPLCFLGMRNLIFSLKHYPNNLGFLDYIFKLKALSGYDYIQDNYSFNQHARQEVYLFKMYVNGATSKFDLVW